MIPQCSVIIPYSNTAEDREAALNFVHAWWKNNFPEWEVIVSSPVPWAKAIACHFGVKQATYDNIILADADSFIYEPNGLIEYIQLIESGVAKWVVPHDKVHRLTEQATQILYKENLLNINKTHYPPYMSCFGGGMVLLSKQAWKDSGGMDVRYIGWGGEDRSFGYALETLVGPVYKGHSKLIHLYHDNQGPRNPISKETIRLIEKYQKARHRPVLMSRLRDEIRDTLEARGGDYALSVDWPM
jgi:hypothetical protein